MGDEAASVTVADLDQLVAEIFSLRAEIAVMNKAVSVQNVRLMGLKSRAVKFLHELNRRDYKAPQGTVRISPKWTVTLPKTIPDKLAFFAWLREREIFDTYATVNSRSLNTLYNKEMEIAQKKGMGMEFSIPGIDNPNLFEDLGIRSPGISEGEEEYE